MVKLVLLTQLLVLFFSQFASISCPDALSEDQAHNSSMISMSDECNHCTDEDGCDPAVPCHHHSCGSNFLGPELSSFKADLSLGYIVGNFSYVNKSYSSVYLDFIKPPIS